jgi:hypothetical protein
MSQSNKNKSLGLTTNDTAFGHLNNARMIFEGGRCYEGVVLNRMEREAIRTRLDNVQLEISALEEQIVTLTAQRDGGE